MTYHCFNTKNKTIALKLIFAVALSDFFYSISNILTAFENEENNTICQVDAFLRQVSVCASIFWVTCTAIICYKSSTSWRLFNQNRFFKQALVIGTFLCIFPTLLPFIYKRMAYSNGKFFCVISYAPSVTTKSEILTIFMLLEGLPILAGFFVSLVAYALAIRNVKRASQGYINQMEINMYRLFWYPGLIFLTFMPCFIDYLFQIYLGDSPVYVEIVHLLLTHSLGFNNALLYGFQRRLYTSKNKKDNATIITATANNNYTDSLTKDLMQASIEDF